MKPEDLKKGDVFIAPFYWDSTEEVIKTINYYDGEYTIVVTNEDDEELIDNVRGLVEDKELFEKQLTQDTFKPARGYTLGGGWHQFKRLGSVCL